MQSRTAKIICFTWNDLRYRRHRRARTSRRSSFKDYEISETGSCLILHIKNDSNQGRRRHGGSGGSCTRCPDGTVAAQGQEVPFQTNLSPISATLSLCKCDSPLSKDGFRGSF